jgi:hypothetical protein
MQSLTVFAMAVLVLLGIFAVHKCRYSSAQCPEEDCQLTFPAPTARPPFRLPPVPACADLKRSLAQPVFVLVLLVRRGLSIFRILLCVLSVLRRAFGVILVGSDPLGRGTRGEVVICHDEEVPLGGDL